jgi:hypothetical protein
MTDPMEKFHEDFKLAMEKAAVFWTGPNAYVTVKVRDRTFCADVGPEAHVADAYEFPPPRTISLITGNDATARLAAHDKLQTLAWRVLRPVYSAETLPQ